jgi:Domain of unknown function (DUF5666)
LNGLWPGDYVSVRAYSDEAGNLIASRIQRRDLRLRAAVGGKPVTCNASYNTLVIAGVVVRTTVGTKFTKRSGKRTGIAGFCSALQDVNFVKAEGIQVENALYASEVRLTD